jgi:hypothetical protein
VIGDPYEWEGKYRRVLRSNTKLNRDNDGQVYRWVIQESEDGPRWNWREIHRSYLPVDWSEDTIAQVLGVPKRSLP